MSVHFNYPPTCSRCGRIHVYCIRCAWSHDLDAVADFHCIRCGAGHYRKQQQGDRLQVEPARVDLSERTQLERLMAAPPATRPEPPPPVPPSQVHLTLFLWDTYPEGTGPIHPIEVYPVWVGWCRRRGVQPRTETWLASNLGRCRYAHRLASGRRWRIRPAPPEPLRPWLEAITRVRLRRPAAADLLERHAQLVMLQDGTAHIRADWLYLARLQRHTAAIQAALGAETIQWEATRK